MMYLRASRASISIPIANNLTAKPAITRCIGRSRITNHPTLALALIARIDFLWLQVVDYVADDALVDRDTDGAEITRIRHPAIEHLVAVGRGECGAVLSAAGFTAG